MVASADADVADTLSRRPLILRLAGWGRLLTEYEWPVALMAPAEPETLRSVQVR